MIENRIKLKEQEKILIIARPGLKSYSFNLFIFIILLLGFNFFLFFLVTQGFYGYLTLICLFLLIVLFGWRIIMIYLYNIYIVTNLRIIGIEQKGIFKRIIIAIDIKNIKAINSFKSKCLHLQLVDDENLVLCDLKERDYIYEVVKNLIEENKASKIKIDFVKREI